MRLSLKNNPNNILMILTILFGLIMVIVTIVFFTWWAMKDNIEFGHDKFDRILWITRSNHEVESCDRGNMAYDLQQNLLHPGTTREEALTLLGRPDWDDDNQMEYDLGYCIHAIHGLRLFFNEKGILTHSRIVQH
jgi:hypothetical protein